MKAIDLSHKLNEHMQVYPGTPKPLFEKVYSIAESGFREARWTMFSHTGTHMDSPAHMEVNGKTLDEFDISQFCGKALVVRIKGESCDKCELDIADLDLDLEDLQSAEFVLLDTNFSKKWGSKDYFEKGPYLSIDAVRELMKNDLKGIGIDQISIDPIDTDDFCNHHEILSKNTTVIIENLKNLEKLPKWIDFMAFPIRVEDCDGSPVRAVARY